MTVAPPTSAGHQALYRRWRAQTFSAMVGQGAVVETLRNAVRLDRLSHGFLFVGPRGTGKTSTARILAKAVNCLDPRDGEPCDACEPCVAIRDGRALDVVELDAASNNRVDDMRELLPRVYTAPSDLRRKVFIIDEVQRIKEGWDVLLKTLEEPPDSVLFIFCTTDPSQIRPAVVSRLQRFVFRPLSVAEIRGKLARILADSEREADPEALELIAHLAAGGMRDAESMLDQVLAGSGDRIAAATVRDLLGLAASDAVDAFVDALVSGDALRGIGTLDALEHDGRDLAAFAEQVVARLRAALVERLGGSASTALGAAATPAELASAARRLSGLDTARTGAGGYRFQLELALLEGIAHDGDAAARPRTAAVTRAPAAESRPPEPVGATPSTTPPPEAAPRDASASATSPPREEPLSGSQPAPSITPSAAADVLAQLLAGWPEVVAHVGRNPANRPLITACRPIEVRDGIVVLGFPEDQPFLRERAELKRTALEDGVRVVLGRAMGVRCVLTNVEASSGSEAARAEGHEAGREDEVDLVEHARRVFGGDVVDVAEIS